MGLASVRFGGERRGDAPVGSPDLLGQAVELREMTLAMSHLLSPAHGVDAEDLLEVFRANVDAMEVEFCPGRDDADRRRIAADFAVLELQQPEQRTEIVPVARPQEMTIVRVALEPVDVREDRHRGGGADDGEPVAA